MKRELLIAQYNNIREAIVSNVQTIKLLVAQSEKLTEIIQQLNSGTKEEDKIKLQQEVEKMQVNILDLISQTEKLFDLYNGFAEELFE